MNEDQNSASPAAETHDELSSAKSQRDEYLQGWQRATADYANLKKEMDRMREEVTKSARASTVEKFLAVLDSFKKAASHAPSLGDGPESRQMRQWMAGIDGIRSQFESAMSSLGVSCIEEAGVPFDPNLHEAMMNEKSESAPGTVLKILEPGYRMGERVIRPAKVSVAE